MSQNKKNNFRFYAWYRSICHAYSSEFNISRYLRSLRSCSEWNDKFILSHFFLRSCQTSCPSFRVRASCQKFTYCDKNMSDIRWHFMIANGLKDLIKISSSRASVKSDKFIGYQVSRAASGRCNATLSPAYTFSETGASRERDFERESSDRELHRMSLALSFSSFADRNEPRCKNPRANESV